MFWREEDQSCNLNQPDQSIEIQFHRRFRNIHLLMELIMIFVISMAGIILFFYAYGDSSVIQVDTKDYVRYYVIIPTLINVSIYVLTYILVKDNYISSAISEPTKDMIMNISFVLLIFSSSTFYQFFPASYVGFSLPVIVSAVYGRYIIIAVTSALSAGFSILGAFFIQYDKDRVVSSFYLVNILIAELLLFICIFYAFLSVSYVKTRVNVMQKSMHMIDKLRDKLNTDSVTGLYTILEFNEYLRKVRLSKDSSSFSVVYLAIDEFMNINSNFGYSYGDKVLNLLADVVGTQENIVAMRYGGAEFVLICRYTVWETSDIMNKLRNEFIKKCKEVLNNPYIGFSAGISQGDAYIQPEVMMAQANSAMNYARTNMKNNICIFNSHNMATDERQFTEQ